VLLLAMDRRLGANLDLEAHQQTVLRASWRHDMAGHPDEVYYGRQYWHWIESHLGSEYSSRAGQYLDLGCGQGRLSLRLAAWCRGDGGCVTGVDISERAIEQARSYARRAQLGNLDYKVADILTYTAGQQASSVHGVFLMEVTFILPKYRTVLAEVVRLLVPGGLLFVAFRPQYYNALYMVNERLWGSLDCLLKAREGRLWGGETYLTWQTADEVHQLLEGSLGLTLLDQIGIGCCSGIPGDPHAKIVRPTELSAQEVEALMKLEITLGRQFPDAGRYMLAVARKTPTSEHPRPS